MCIRYSSTQAKPKGKNTLKQSSFGCKRNGKIKSSLLCWHSVKSTNPFDELKKPPFHCFINTFYRYHHCKQLFCREFGQNLVSERSHISKDKCLCGLIMSSVTFDPVSCWDEPQGFCSHLLC